MKGEVGGCKEAWECKWGRRARKVGEMYGG